MPTAPGRRVSVQWAMLLVEQLAVPLPYDVHVFEDYSVATAREKLGQVALEGGADWLLWWDDDIWPPRDGIELALRHRYPIVSGCYVDRVNRPASANLAEWEGEVRQFHLPFPKAGQITYRDAAGLGFCLMDARVLRRVSRPWFLYSHDLGEDYHLFGKIKRELGIPVLLDGDIAIGHERPVQVGPDTVAYPLSQTVPS
jgi:hypothetical protein